MRGELRVRWAGGALGTDTGWYLPGVEHLSPCIIPAGPEDTLTCTSDSHAHPKPGWFQNHLLHPLSTWLVQ